MLVLLMTNANAQSSLISCDGIIWDSNRKLSWSDFMASANQSIPYAAMTFESINYSYNWVDNRLHFESKTAFSPCLSWTKYQEAENLLLHEQGHFNVAEIFRRLLVKSVLENEINSSGVKSKLSTIYQDIVQQKEAFQKQYDLETDYSRDVEKQLQWSKNIEKMLRQLDQYNKESIEVDMK